ncbi:MAG: sigma-70 family RNA polymerase sigma factor [Actinobacteria bacterium]|nr:sigma-70 family RNA polymerase sigma factor [Actinomycetota bacterium]
MSPGHDGRGSDSRLLQSVAERDREAFEELYRRYARPVYGLALRRLGDRERAEEAVQETFASVWRSAESFDASRGAGASWVYAIARNSIVDRLRARRDTVAELPDTVAPEGGPDEAAEAGWIAWRVHRALEELPPAEREVLELAYWSGLSQSEVARFLNLPLGTVKTRTRSALGRLGRLLEREDLA